MKAKKSGNGDKRYNKRKCNNFPLFFYRNLATRVHNLVDDLIFGTESLKSNNFVMNNLIFCGRAKHDHTI